MSHRPDPAWVCACGDDWPCVSERSRLAALWSPAVVASMMRPYLVRAAECEALAEVPWSVLYARFVGWAWA